jgi:hypothetical protein
LPTFSSERFRIVWSIHFEGRVRWWPDLREEFTLTVSPGTRPKRFASPAPAAAPSPAAGGPMELRLEGGRTTFPPGATVAGEAKWRLPSAPAKVEARLFWYTPGEDPPDLGVAARLAFENPAASDRRPFRFRVPDAPYSYNGKLFSIAWAVELVAEPSGETARVGIAVGPSG